MNTAKLAVLLSSFVAVSAIVACSAAPSAESVGSNEQHATANTASRNVSKRVNTGRTVRANNSSTTNGDASAPPAPTECIGDTVPAAPVWKAPGAKQNVCTPADLQKLNDVAQTAQTWNDLKTPMVAQNAACASCIFTNDSDPNWGPIVLATDGSGGGYVNWSSCFASVDGGSAACGEAFYDQQSCGESMCSSCTDDPSFQNCYGEATNDPGKCGQYDLETACNGFATVNSACPDVFATIAVNCGGQ
jgi:hypothetical protein